MTRIKETAAWAAVAALVAGGVWFVMDKPDRPAPKSPREAIRETSFPLGLDQMVGDENGQQCGQVLLRIQGHPDRRLPRGVMDGLDFRTATPEQKSGHIRAWAERTVEGSGDLASCGPEPSFPLGSSLAFAPPICNIDECGGEGCISYGCPADLVIPYPNCFWGGPDCTIVVICCGSPCTPVCG